MRIELKHIPAEPGIYIFKSTDGRPLYVGKAKNLRNRLVSYNGAQPDRPWTEIMVTHAATVETTIVQNETEALILEANLIRQLQPQYNIKLTDDKRYPLIRLVDNEDFPRLEIVRRQDRPGRYFGPYLSSVTARRVIELLRRLYGIHLGPKPIKYTGRRCFYCQLNNQPCPQAEEISVESYRAKISKAVEILNGKRSLLIDDLKSLMADASHNQQFERAAHLRDDLAALQQVKIKQDVSGHEQGVDFDVIGLVTSRSQTTVVVLHWRDGALGRQERFYLAGSTQSSADQLRQFLISYYATLEIAPQLVIGEELEDQTQIEKLLSQARGSRVSISSNPRGRKRRLLTLASENAALAALTKSGNENSEASLLTIARWTNLDKLPERIEFIDISNLGVSEPVGVTTVFVNGESDKNEYRRYKIKTVQGQNDFAMVAEIVTRRLSDERRTAPDLLIIDGGRGQLASATRAAKLINSSVKIVSLAKKPDRLFVTGSLGRVLGRDAASKLLINMRDETHRYAIGFHRSRLRRSQLPDGS